MGRLGRWLVVCVIGLGGACAPGAAPTDGQDVTVLIGARVISMADHGVQSGFAVVARGDSITWVGPVGELVVPGDARVIDVEGRFVIPGLTDMHVHSSTAAELASYVRYGVTSVLHMGEQLGRFGSGVRSSELRDRVRAGDLYGPTLFTVGRVHAGG